MYKKNPCTRILVIRGGKVPIYERRGASIELRLEKRHCLVTAAKFKVRSLARTEKVRASNVTVRTVVTIAPTFECSMAQNVGVLVVVVIAARSVTGACPPSAATIIVQTATIAWRQTGS